MTILPEVCPSAPPLHHASSAPGLKFSLIGPSVAFATAECASTPSQSIHVSTAPVVTIQPATIIVGEMNESTSLRCGRNLISTSEQVGDSYKASRPRPPTRRSLVLRYIDSQSALAR